MSFKATTSSLQPQSPHLQPINTQQLPSNTATIASKTLRRLTSLTRTMSTTTQHSSTPAPWKKPFLEHISKMSSPEFVLSTLTPAPAGSSTPYLPRARYCIYRGMWTELPENKHNDAPQNPKVYTSEMPTFTTDVRMEKVGQLFASSAGHADKESLIQGSGGGGPVEAVWWVKDEGIMTQWRIKGEAFVVGTDIEEHDSSSGVRTVKSEVGSRMKVLQEGEGKEGEWSWLKEMDAHFGNCSPGMRGSWKNPPPGLPKDAPYDLSLKLGQKVSELHDEVARKNFRVVIIKPESVEQCDISDPEKAHRIIYTYQPQSNDWKQVETWP